MRRRALVLLSLALVLTACGGGKVVAPLPATVIGSVPAGPTIPKGDPVAGKKLFISNGCGGCHTFKSAGTTGKVGPDLDKVAADAQKANQGPLDQYVFESIKNPSAYVVPGFPNGVMPNYGMQLTDKQIADLTAFIVKNAKH